MEYECWGLETRQNNKFQHDYNLFMNISLKKTKRLSTCSLTKQTDNPISD